MAELRLYSIYDSVAKQYSSPMPARNDDIAVRHFVRYAQDNKVTPEVVAALSLWFLGTMDDETGTINSVSGPIEITGTVPYSKADDLTEIK